MTVSVGTVIDAHPVECHLQGMIRKGKSITILLSYLDCGLLPRSSTRIYA